MPIFLFPLENCISPDSAKWKKRGRKKENCSTRGKTEGQEGEEDKNGI